MDETSHHWGRGGCQALQTGQDRVGKCVTRFKEWGLHNQVWERQAEAEEPTKSIPGLSLQPQGTKPRQVLASGTNTERAKD